MVVAALGITLIAEIRETGARCPFRPQPSVTQAGVPRVGCSENHNKMSNKTKIQWCHSTVNPIMGCGGCELFPFPGKILRSVDASIAGISKWPTGKSREVFRGLIRDAFSRIQDPLPGHSSTVTTTNIWHLRELFYAEVLNLSGPAAAKAAEGSIARAMTCYAATLHLNKGRSIVNPNRGANKGYAPTFERVTRFEGRVWKMARERDLLARKNHRGESTAANECCKYMV